MSLQSINTENMGEVVKTIRLAVKRYSQSKVKIKNLNNNLVTEWVGLSSNAYERQSKLLIGKMDDIEDELYELCEAIMESELKFMETDENLAKEFKK